MRKIASFRAAGELVKTASAVLVQQQREIESLRAQLADRERADVAADLAVRMANAGHIDRADMEEKAAEFARDPSRIPVIQEAVNLLDTGRFTVASLADEQGRGHTARSQLEAYLLGNN
jgi:hypothetical protein